MPIYSLAYLTSVPLVAPDAITLAAELGYGTFGLSVLPAVPDDDFSPLIDNKPLLRETVARCKATRVAVFANSSHTTLADLASMPDSRLSYAQICDGPGEIPTADEGLIHTARLERLLPDEGSIDLVGIFAQLPPGLPSSIEIPNEKRMREPGTHEWTRRGALSDEGRNRATRRCPAKRREPQGGGAAIVMTPRNGKFDNVSRDELYGIENREAKQ